MIEGPTYSFTVNCVKRHERHLLKKIYVFREIFPTVSVTHTSELVAIAPLTGYFRWTWTFLRDAAEIHRHDWT